MKIRPIFSFLLTCGTLLLLDGMTPLYAQPDTGGPQPGNAAATGVPLDGGASLLLVAGVGLGLKRLRRRRRDTPPT